MLVSQQPCSLPHPSQPRHSLLSSRMAIIQDLPPELLEKVIDYTSVLEAYDKDDVVNPYELATVSKDWLEAGQRVFFQHVELSEERVERFLACAKHRRERTSDLFFVGRLSLPRKPPAKLDQVFKAIHVRRLESRRSEKIPWEDLHSTRKLSLMLRLQLGCDRVDIESAHTLSQRLRT